MDGQDLRLECARIAISVPKRMGDARGWQDIALEIEAFVLAVPESEFASDEFFGPPIPARRMETYAEKVKRHASEITVSRHQPRSHPQNGGSHE